MYTASDYASGQNNVMRNFIVLFLAVLILYLGFLALSSVDALTMSSTAATSAQTLTEAQVLAFANDHAAGKHGAIAWTIAETCRSDPIQTWQNPNTQRMGTICTVEGIWCVGITEEDGSPVTCFPKEKLSRIEQVQKYLHNRGYTDLLKQ